MNLFLKKINNHGFAGEERIVIKGKPSVKNYSAFFFFFQPRIIKNADIPTNGNVDKTIFQFKARMPTNNIRMAKNPNKSIEVIINLRFG